MVGQFVFMGVAYLAFTGYGIWVAARHRLYVHLAVIALLLVATGTGLCLLLSLFPNALYPEGISEAMRSRSAGASALLFSGLVLTPLSAVAAAVRVNRMRRAQLREKFGEFL